MIACIQALDSLDDLDLDTGRSIERERGARMRSRMSHPNRTGDVAGADRVVSLDAVLYQGTARTCAASSGL